MSRPSLLLVTRTARVAGAERIVLRLAESLVDDFEVRTAVVSRGGGSGDGRAARSGGLATILFGRADIVHSHLFLPGLLVRLRRAWDGRFRWVHSVHYDAYASQRFGRLKRWLDHRWIFPAADELVAVSGAVLRTLADHPNRTLIENEVDLGAVEVDGAAEGPRAGAPVDGGAGGPAALAEPDVRIGAGSLADHARGEPRTGPETGPVVGTVAMLRAEKGVDDLVHAFGALRETHPEARLRIAGDGPEWGALGALIRSLGLEGAVELCGYVDDLDAFYAGLDVYVQPSHQESFGLATLESMRFSVPVVVAAVGNLADVVQNGRFGLAVPRDGSFVDGLAAAMNACLAASDEYRRKAGEGLAFWRERLKPGAMVEGHRALYRKVLRPGVCMISPIVTQSTGGLQRQLFLQSRELRALGHRVCVLQRRDPRLGGASDLAERWSHVAFLQTPDLFSRWGRPGGASDRLRGLAFLAFGLLQLARHRRRFDVIHAHQLYSPTLIGALAKVLLRKKLVVKVTASGHLGELGQLHRLPFLGLRRVAFRRIDRLIVLNEAMKAEMVELGFGPDMIRLIPNSVAIPETAAEQPKPDGEPLRLLFTGRLSEEKCLDTLLDAGGLLAERGVAVEIDLVGGPDPSRGTDVALRSRAAELEGRVTVRFHGFKPDTAPFYLAADAFVLPSVSEGMSNALLEALAYGLVCVASNIPENRALLVDDANGLLFEQGSAASLAERLGGLVDREGARDRERIARLSVAARAAARERFSAEAVAERLAALYAEL